VSDPCPAISDFRLESFDCTQTCNLQSPIFTEGSRPAARQCIMSPSERGCYSTSVISPPASPMITSSRARKYQSVPLPPISESSSPASFSTFTFAFKETTGDPIASAISVLQLSAFTKPQLRRPTRRAYAQPLARRKRVLQHVRDFPAGQSDDHIIERP
jgi:hypothetical protein